MNLLNLKEVVRFLVSDNGFTKRGLYSSASKLHEAAKNEDLEQTAAKER